jgi:hypothetical protein
MSSNAMARKLGGFLGAGFFIFGVIESGIALASESVIVLFWLPALCGGGAAIVAGTYTLREPLWLSKALIIVGACSGALATAWTLIVPLAAAALIVLTVSRRPVEEPPETA